MLDFAPPLKVEQKVIPFHTNFAFLDKLSFQCLILSINLSHSDLIGIEENLEEETSFDVSEAVYVNLSQINLTDNFVAL